MMLISTTAFFLIAFDIFVTYYFVDENVDHLSICEHVSEPELKDILYATIKIYRITMNKPIG